MAKSRGRFSTHAALTQLLLLGAVGILAALPRQQPQTAPAPAGPPAAAASNTIPPEILQQLRVQSASPTVDPPAPAPGEGVELSIRVVDAITGKGLPNVKVDIARNLGSVPRVALSPNGGPAVPPDRRRWSYSKSTDALGAVTLPDVFAESYTIAPTLDGYILAKGAADSVTLVKGKKPAPVLFRMWRAASIEGIVQDRDGNPVPNATVEVLEENWIGGLRTLNPMTANLPTALQRPTVTDSAGVFAFKAVLPGSYYLRAIPQSAMVQQQLKASPPDKPAAFVDTLYPAATMLEQAAPLKIDAGGSLFGLRIEMQKAAYYSFSGKVTGIPPEVRGSGLVLIRRAAFDSPFPFVWNSPYAGASSAQIKPDGTFSAPAVAPGPYWAGYTPAGPVRGGAQFLIEDRNVEGFAIEVVPGIDFAGRAVYEDGTPATGLSGKLSVFLTTMGVYVRGMSVGPTGDFATGGLPAGPYRLEFSSAVVVRKVEVNRRTFQGGEFELTPLGGNATITLGRAGAVIQGSVDLREQAKAYARGMVTVAPVPLKPMDTPSRRYLAGNNTFAIDHLEAGRYRVCAWLEEGSDVDSVLGNPRFEQKLGVDCQTVTLSADENRTLQLKQISAQDFK